MTGLLAGSPGAWERLAPDNLHRTEPLAAIDAYLAQPTTAAALDADDRAATYPRAVLAELRARGANELFLPDRASPPELGALNAVTARRSGGLAITVGVTALGLLPVYLAGSAGQRRLVAERLRAGAGAALLLTERYHGSNLLRNEAAASPAAGGYRLDGAKDLINGGTEHSLLVALLRTGRSVPNGLRPAGLRDFTLFLVERDDTVEALARWRTLPARPADISGVRFRNTRVPAEAVIGRAGDGFALVQKALMMSHGGIAALASGAVSGALEVAMHHARTRDVYGGPIVALGGIAEHLVRMAVLDVVVAAVAVKAAYASNRFGPGAGYFGTAAKYAGCRLAEEAVTEGRYVVGARALLEDLPYARFVRDVLLYGVFDGTSHVMLDELGRHTARLANAGRPRPTLDLAREVYTTPPRPITVAAREPWRPYAPALLARCGDLAAAADSEDVACLASMAIGLAEVVRAARSTGHWDAEQAFRFDAAAVLAELEALLAACELASPECRAALGVAGEPTGLDEAAARYALGWLGGRLHHRLQELAREVGTADASHAVEDLARPAAAPDARDRVRAFVAGRETTGYFGCNLTMARH